MDGAQKILHAFFGVLRFTLTVRKQLYSHNVGVAIDDTAAHQ
ncbi:Uncharacterised protein [Vibrio cholerae]|nr:Uncharacterised protein [Vibrio cholerae]CSD14692.1 Uncharacterised protein [Vibrio cholerae]CSI70229.1 Uncharacterised protein [Vibrio cholerae]